MSGPFVTITTRLPNLQANGQYHTSAYQSSPFVPRPHKRIPTKGARYAS